MSNDEVTDDFIDGLILDSPFDTKYAILGTRFPQPNLLARLRFRVGIRVRRVRIYRLQP